MRRHVLAARVIPGDHTEEAGIRAQFSAVTVITRRSQRASRIPRLAYAAVTAWGRQLMND